MAQFGEGSFGLPACFLGAQQTGPLADTRHLVYHENEACLNLLFG